MMRTLNNKEEGEKQYEKISETRRIISILQEYLFTLVLNHLVKSSTFPISYDVYMAFDTKVQK
jgi:hypothetical protein